LLLFKTSKITDYFFLLIFLCLYKMNKIEMPLLNINLKEKKIYSPQEIPIMKLLSMAKKDDLLDFLDLTSFWEIEQQIKAQNDGKFKVSEMKKYIFEHSEYLEHFRRSPIVVWLYEDYDKKMQKLNSAKSVKKLQALKNLQRKSMLDVLQQRHLLKYMKNVWMNIIIQQKIMKKLVLYLIMH